MVSTVFLKSATPVVLAKALVMVAAFVLLVTLMKSWLKPFKSTRAAPWTPSWTSAVVRMALFLPRRRVPSRMSNRA